MCYAYSDILKVDLFCRPNITFEIFAQENALKIPKSPIKYFLKTFKKYVTIVQMHDFSSFGKHISRIFANSVKFCGVP